MARYQRKRARELQHDRFRDTTMNIFDRLGDRLEGKGRAIMYGIVGVIALAVLFSLWSSWRERKANEARRALGHAIEIAEAPVGATASANATGPSFPSERERAQKAVEEFQKVAATYPDPYSENARYFAANNLLVLDRNKGLGELQALTKSGDTEIAPLAKFALAQAYEADAKYSEAAQLYGELVKANSGVIPADTANLRLAAVYEKLDKKKEATDIYFTIADSSRKAKSADGKPLPSSAAARAASQKLETLDPDRYAKLPPEASNLSF